MNCEVVVLDEAEEELTEAHDWYEANRPGLGLEFRLAIEEAMRRLIEETAAALPIPGVNPSSGIRRVFVKRFPYSIVFMEHGNAVWILAFAHHHRRPGYWRTRKP